MTHPSNTANGSSNNNVTVKLEQLSLKFGNSSQICVSFNLKMSFKVKEKTEC